MDMKQIIKSTRDKLEEIADSEVRVILAFPEAELDKANQRKISEEDYFYFYAGVGQSKEVEEAMLSKINPEERLDKRMLSYAVSRRFLEKQNLPIGNVSKYSSIETMKMIKLLKSGQGKREVSPEQVRRVYRANI